MKIGVVSDTHGALKRWQQVYEKFLYECDLIIHAGDILYHGPRNAVPADYDPKELALRLNNLSVPLVAVQGNCDSEVDQMVLDFPIETSIAHLYIDGLNIIVNHGHRYKEDEQVGLIKRYRADLLVCGHTHVGTIVEAGDGLLVNPGSIAMSKREDGRSTLMLIEEGVVKLLDAESSEMIDKRKINLKR